MQDLTQYSDQELSFNVFNTEYFYIERHNKPYLMALVAEEFIYTPEQMSELEQDLLDEAEEK